jgi:membrane protease YdiL (CAAX protease family)
MAGCLWLVAANLAASNYAQGIIDRLHLVVLEPILQQVFLAFLLLAGFAMLDWMVCRRIAFGAANALPSRPTAGQEWLRGAALGWGMLLAAVIPMVLLGALHPQLWLATRSWMLALLSLATLALMSLALELAFRGYLFQQLIAVVGPVAATILLSLVYALLSAFRPGSTALSIAFTFLAGVLFSAAYLRTHALWLGWGLHFAWAAAISVFFGLPLAGDISYSSLVTMTATGPALFTGGVYGPEGAALTLVVLLGAILVLYRITRDYAWNYTHPEIVSAGYPMDIAPPAAHIAMESAAASSSPLVTISAITPSNASTLPVIDEHLRTTQSAEDKRIS